MKDILLPSKDSLNLIEAKESEIYDSEDMMEE